MKKLCYITTKSITIKSFVLKSIEFLHNQTDWDFSIICDEDDVFADSLPSYIHYYPVRMERGISFSGLKAINQIKKIFKKEKFDLIQYSTPNASLYASIAGWMAKMPIRLYCQWGIAYVGFQGIKRKIFKAIEKLVCKLSTHIQPDSFSNLNFATTQNLYSAKKGTVIGRGSACGVDLEKFNFIKKEQFRNKIRKKYAIDENTFVFGFVGRINRDKGINELFSAIKLFLQEREAVLLIVGSEEKDERLNKQLLDWAHKDERIIFCGHTDSVECYMAAMDCFILPSYREGFGTSVIEAEAMGVPVIVTDIPGPIDAMQQQTTGYKITKGSTDELLNTMKLLYESDRRSEMGKNGVEFVKENFEQNQLFYNILQNRKDLLGIE